MGVNQEHTPMDIADLRHIIEKEVRAFPWRRTIWNAVAEMQNRAHIYASLGGNQVQGHAATQQ